MEYPNLSYIKNRLRNNLTKPVKYKVLRVYIIGSHANGSFNENSDIDFAIIIPKVKNKSSLKISENYHSCFTSNDQKPYWQNRILDFQFFYEDDIELYNLSKFEIL